MDTSSYVFLRCPSGHAMYAPEDYLGRRARCRTCGIAFQLALPEEETKQEDVSITPLARSAPRTALRMLGWGVTLHLAKCYLAIVGLLVIWIWSVRLLMAAGPLPAGQLGQQRRLAVVEQQIQPAVTGLLLVCVGCGLAGSVQMLAVPPAAHARHLIRMSLILDVAPLLMGPLLLFAPPGPVEVILVVNALTSAASLGLFLFFLQRLARYLRRPDLVSQTIHLMGLSVLIGVSLAISLGLYHHLAGGNRQAPWLLVGGIFALIITGFAWLTRYIWLLHGFRGALSPQPCWRKV